MGLQYKIDICTCHGKERFIVKKILPNKYCHIGNQARLAERKRSSESYRTPKALPWNIKPTGEKILFETIWNTRKRVSFVSGASLGDECNVMFMSHILSKGAYPGFRLYEKNIVLKTTQEHYDWHNMPRAKLLEKDSNWQKVFDLELELKTEYYDN